MGIFEKKPNLNMSKITIKSGKGELTLKKSKNLVGLKSPDKALSEREFVEKEVILVVFQLCLLIY